MSKGCRRLEADSRSAIAEGEVGRMVELERSGQVEARALSYYALVAHVCPGKGGRKVQACAARARLADRGNRPALLVRRSADGDLVAHTETVRVADFNIRRAGIRICREIRVVRLRAHARDRDSLDPVADAFDVQPDLV